MIERRIGKRTLRLLIEDPTAMEIEAFVHDIAPDMKLGSGFGGAIQQRGGIIIQKELDAIGKCPVGEAVITQAGILKAKQIIHVNGPKFREEDEEGKLARATRSALALADEKQIRQLAFPAIGTGLYQVPLDLCARVMVQTITEHLRNETGIEEVLITVRDTREYEPFAKQLEKGD